MKDVYAQKWRLWEVDFLRGIAVIFMIVFHYFWAINYFGVYNIGMNTVFWKGMGTITAGIFIVLVGISLTLSYAKSSKKKTGHVKKYVLRGLKLFGLGFIVTFTSYFLLSEGQVWFGILHFIGLSIILTVPFLNLKRTNLFLGLIFIVVGLILKDIVVNFSWLFWLGLTYPGFNSIDFFPIFPWFGLVLIGIFLGKTIFPDGKRIVPLKQKPNKVSKIICLLGRNSLIIYFLHMIIILGAIFTFLR